MQSNSHLCYPSGIHNFSMEVAIFVFEELMRLEFFVGLFLVLFWVVWFLFFFLNLNHILSGKMQISLVFVSTNLKTSTNLSYFSSSTFVLTSSSL